MRKSAKATPRQHPYEPEQAQPIAPPKWALNNKHLQANSPTAKPKPLTECGAILCELVENTETAGEFVIQNLRYVVSCSKDNDFAILNHCYAGVNAGVIFGQNADFDRLMPNVNDLKLNTLTLENQKRTLEPFWDMVAQDDLPISLHFKNRNYNSKQLKDLVAQGVGCADVPFICAFVFDKRTGGWVRLDNDGQKYVWK